MDTQFDSRIKGFDLGTLKSPEKDNGYIAGSSSRAGSGSGLSDVKKSVELLENKLGKNLPGFTLVSELNPANFTPTAVADRILGFVTNAITQRAGSDLEAQSMLRQAKEGIARGFSEAREILSGMPLMTDEIGEQIKQTESLIFEGLDNLQSAPVDTSRQQIISENASLSSEFKQSSQASIQIVTQDGDKVDVSYAALIQYTEAQSYSANQQAASASYEFSSQASASFQFSVQGNLDEGERQAINELLNDVGDLANQFFNGDVQAAFSSAQALGFDSKELKSFALDFQQSTYVEVVQTYQRTEQISPERINPERISPQQMSQSTAPVANPAPAIDVLLQLENLIEQTKDTAKIESPQMTIKSLLSGMLDLLNEDSKSPVQNYIKDIIDGV